MTMFCPAKDQNFQYFKKEVEKNNEMLERKPLFIYNPETKIDEFNKQNNRDFCLSMLMDCFKQMKENEDIVLLKNNVLAIEIHGYKEKYIKDNVDYTRISLVLYDCGEPGIIESEESYTFIYHQKETLVSFLNTGRIKDFSEPKKGTYYDLYRILKYFNIAL